MLGNRVVERRRICWRRRVRASLHSGEIAAKSICVLLKDVYELDSV